MTMNQLKLRKKNSKLLGKISANFYCEDAWKLSLNSQFDIIASNGLNIYEPNDQKVEDLYRKFYQSLKSNGILITSFATPPPALSKNSTWKNYNPDDVIKQKALLMDIIGAKFQTFRTEKQEKELLERVGFKIVSFIYDSQGMFPTVVVKK